MNMTNEYSFAIDADHIQMTKFVNRLHTGYRQILLHILQMMRNSFPEVYSLEQLGRFND